MAKTSGGKGKAKEQAGGQANEQPAGKSIQDVDLAGDAVAVVSTAIGVVGGVAGFIGSKVAEAVTGKTGGRKPPASKAAKPGGAKKAVAATGAAAKKTGGAKKTGAAKKTAAK